MPPLHEDDVEDLQECLLMMTLHEDDVEDFQECLLSMRTMWRTSRNASS